MITTFFTGPGWTWNQTGAAGARVLGNGVANITYCTQTPMQDVDQALILIDYRTAFALHMRIGWFPDAGGTPHFDVIGQFNSIAANVCFYDYYILDVTFQASAATQTQVAFPRPAAAPFMQVGFYEAGVVAAADNVEIIIVPQRGGQVR